MGSRGHERTDAQASTRRWCAGCSPRSCRSGRTCRSRRSTVDGWDNRTYRLGDDLTVRLPTAAGYAPAVDKEDRWLPVLAPHAAAPGPGAGGARASRRRSTRSAGRSAAGWTVTPRGADRIEDPVRLRRGPGRRSCARCGRSTPTGGPAAGAHSFFRGCAARALRRRDARALVSRSTDASTPTGPRPSGTRRSPRPRTGPPVWFHGDIADGNLLVRDGRLSRGDRLRHLRCRRPGLRPGDRVDVLLRGGPARPSGTRSARTPPRGRAPAAGRCGRRSSPRTCHSWRSCSRTRGLPPDRRPTGGTIAAPIRGRRAPSR